MEIERKFLMHSLPDGKLIRRTLGHQGYLMFDPELRVRDKTSIDISTGNVLDDTKYYATLKSVGTTIRDEVEGRISEEFYQDIAAKINEPFITKVSYIMEDPNGVEFIVSVVDPEEKTSFIYAEVEFASEEEMEKYVWPYPDKTIREVSGDPYYMMQNYWKRTRTLLDTPMSSEDQEGE